MLSLQRLNSLGCRLVGIVRKGQEFSSHSTKFSKPAEGVRRKRKRNVRSSKTREKSRSIKINKKIVECFKDAPRRATPKQLDALRHQVAALLEAHPAEELNLVNVSTLLSKSARCGLSLLPYLSVATRVVDRATTSPGHRAVLSDWSMGNLVYALKVTHTPVSQPSAERHAARLSSTIGRGWRRPRTSGRCSLPSHGDRGHHPCVRPGSSPRPAHEPIQEPRSGPAHQDLAGIGGHEPLRAAKDGEPAPGGPGVPDGPRRWDLPKGHREA